ncbi:type II toxin-antitoxin system VapC family toxin [uncultured Desulfosarcina sp.]|uniref:type II toxin-antitoxin system VapC family toxin n=1 Tax=uncultured Desulfosarcina sp. TaxID=218289 RepID=UPI0029C90053|nr:type II toxin-antitoxin system VapC family toxin [uncultured Desulfosarcina sp.]
MSGIFIDSNVILDLFLDDPNWAQWSETTLEHYARHGRLYISPVVYSEISIGFERIEDLEQAVAAAGFQMVPIPREALFLAGKAFMAYRQRSGRKSSPLPDFFIGAQAAVIGLPLITRDVARYRTYFPRLKLIHP